MAAVHVSPYAGEWYPGHASDLERLLAERFEESRRRMGPYLPPGGVGFVVPHAGPSWSGTVASAVYRSLAEMQPEQVIVLGFPHHGRLGRIATPDVESIATPFGAVAIDRSLAPKFPPAEESRICDHSFEIQLPFLQRAVPKARVTPLYVGSVTPAQRSAAAEALARHWRPGIVFVASSDFTHYGRQFGFQPFPHDSATQGRLRELDFECVEAAGSLNSEWFLETLDANRATVCGSGPIALLLAVLQRLPAGGVYARTLDYQASGEINGDFAHSVSYAGLGFYPRASFDLVADDRSALLESASETLRRLRETGDHEPVAARGSAALTERRGVFVSLHHGDELLGCVGNCTGRNSLAEDVADLTIAAATEDPRFQPAARTKGEIQIEISVLTPLRRIRGPADFQLGKHGAFLSLGQRCGLLLPQVAEGRQWAAEDFLRALSRKSGLWTNAWEDKDAEVWVFEAQVFAA